MQCEGIFAMTGSSDWLLVYSMLVIFGGMCATQILLWSAAWSCPPSGTKPGF